MNIHIAYPNASYAKQKFLGCGRYLPFETDPKNSDYQPVSPDKTAEFPQIDSLIAHQVAHDAAKEDRLYLYEKQDDPQALYRGSSKELAYLLARIACVRQFKLSFAHDIWCTGSIGISNNAKYPALIQAVDSEVFQLKFAAFLAETNRDLLFVVPEADMTLERRQLCETQGAQVWLLNEFQEFAQQPELTCKTLLAVQPDELFRLISLVFQPGENPYKGLEAFQEEDADRFFGREIVIETAHEKCETLLATPSAPRLFAILGHSGSGKSSLMRAGLLPKLKQTFHCLPPCRPGNAPLETVHDIQAARNDTVEPLIILIDQFEEVYAPDVDEQQRSRFLDLLFKLATAPDAPTLIVFTLREDIRKYLDARFDSVIAQDAHHLYVPKMSDEEIHRAILEPAKRAGSIFDNEVALVTKILHETEGNLPLLEFALYQMWEQVKSGKSAAEVVETVGNIREVLSQKAESLFQTFATQDDKELVRHIFLQLFQFDEKTERYVRRSNVPLEKLAMKKATPSNIHDMIERFFQTISKSRWIKRFPAILGTVEQYYHLWHPKEEKKNDPEQLSDVRRIVECFAGQEAARLLELFGNKDHLDNQFVELTHESIYNEWTRLKTWLEENLDDLRLRSRLEHAAIHWDKTGRASGALWDTPDLEQLVKYSKRVAITDKVQQAFFYASVWKKQSRRMIWMAVFIGFAILTAISIIGFKRAREAESDAIIQRNLTSEERELALKQSRMITYELVDELAKIPRTMPILRSVLEKNIQDLEQLVERDPQTPLALREKASNLSRLGETWLKLGSTDEALHAYQQSSEIFKLLAEQNYPDKTQAQRDLAASYDTFCFEYLRLQKTSDAQSVCQQSFEIIQALAQANPDRVDLQRDLSSSYGKLVILYSQQGEDTASEKMMTAAETGAAFTKQLAEAHPDDAQIQRDLSVSYSNLGDAHQQIGNQQAALDAFKQSLDISTRLAEKSPDDPQTQRDVFNDYVRLGNIYAQRGEMSEAISMQDKAMAIAERLARLDPENMKTQSMLAMAYYKSGTAQLRRANNAARSPEAEEAMQIFERGVEVAKRIVEQDTDNAEAQKVLASLYSGVGQARLLFKENDDLQETLKFYEMALAIELPLAQKESNNMENQYDLALSYLDIGEIYMRSSDVQTALKRYEEGLTIAQYLAEQSAPSKILAQRLLMNAWFHLGDAEKYRLDNTAAMDNYAQGGKILEQLVQDSPDNLEIRQELVIYYIKMGILADGGLENANEALKWYRRALPLAEQFVKDPSNVGGKRNLEFLQERIKLLSN